MVRPLLGRVEMNSSLGLAILLAASSASAQPMLISEASPKPDEAHLYVAAGTTLGGDRGGLYLNPTLEVGTRISGSWWLHGQLTGGGNQAVDELTYSGSRVVMRAGAEDHLCVWHEAACAVLGADLAVRQEQYMAEYDVRSIRDVAIARRSRGRNAAAAVSPRDRNHDESVARCRWHRAGREPRLCVVSVVSALERLCCPWNNLLR